MTLGEPRLMRNVSIIICALFIGDVLLAFLFGLNILAGQPSSFVSHFLDLDGEATFPAWYSSIKLSAVGILFAVLTVMPHVRGREGKGFFMLASILFMFLSMDEVVGVHE